MKITAALMALMFLAPASADARGQCNAKSKKPKDSWVFDPLDIKHASLLQKKRKSICNWTTEFAGRPGTKNLRVVMTKAQFKACIKKVGDGKKPQQIIMYRVKKEADKKSVAKALSLDGHEDEKVATIVSKQVVNSSLSMLLGTISPYSGLVKDAADLVYAISAAKCGIKKSDRQQMELETLLETGGWFTYDVNLTRSVNARGESLFQEAVSYQVELGRTEDGKTHKIRVVPLLQRNLLVKLK